MTALVGALSPPARADPLWAMLTHLRACLCATLAKGGRGVCVCAVVPGNSPPPADRCDCVCENGQGQAWVRWVRDLPYTASGASQNRRQCAQLRTRKVFEVGVYRCVTGPGENGAPPDVAGRERDAEGVALDRSLLRSAVACCPAFTGKQMSLVSLEPAAVMGQCTGVVLQFSVDV